MSGIIIVFCKSFVLEIYFCNLVLQNQILSHSSQHKMQKKISNQLTWWLDFYTDFGLCLQHRNVFNSSDTVWKIGWDWLDKLEKDKIAFQKNLLLMFDSLQSWAFLSVITHLGMFRFRFCGMFYITEVLVCQDYDITDDISKQKINSFYTVLLIH